MNPHQRHLIQTEDTLGAHNYKPLDVILSRGEGVWVLDTDGTRFLDCLSAYSAVNQGGVIPSVLQRTFAAVSDRG